MLKTRPRKSRSTSSLSFIRSSYGRRLRAEQLEERQMLTGVTVGNALDIVNAPDTSSIAALIADDGGDGISLREAITAANNDTIDPTDTVSFDPSVFATPQTLGLTLGELPITDSVAITGPGQDLLTISGNNASRIFNVDDGSAATLLDVSLTGMTLRDGLEISNSSSSADRQAASGGAIYSSENLTISASTIANSESRDATGGGGIATFGPSSPSDPTPRLRVVSSSIAGNRTDDTRFAGGGIFAEDSDVEVVDSTVSGNEALTSGTAYSGGGGIGLLYGSLQVVGSTISGNTLNVDTSSATGTPGGGGIANFYGAATIRHSTIADNFAFARNTGYSSGGGLFGNFTLEHTIVAGNTSDTPGAGQDDVNGSITSRYSLIEFPRGSNINDLGGTITGVPASLGPLADNGGTTLTHALLPGSPAINAGDPNAVAGSGNTPNFDQRGSGFNRVNGLRLDIGAFEDQSNFPPVITSPTAVSVNENVQFVQTLTAIDDAPQTAEFRILGQGPAGDLGPSQSLEVDQTISSPDGTAVLIMQGDGNLVVYDSGVPVWSAGTDGTSAVRATIEENGNLVLTDGSGGVVFQTNSGSAAGSLARLHVTNEGLLQILRVDNALLWEGLPLPSVGMGTTFNPAPLAPEFTKAVDSDLFQVVNSDLQLQVAADFELPTDADGNNVYEVTVLADDSNGGVAAQTVSVNVTNVAESMTFVVDNLGDDVDGDFSAGQLSLREAVLNANANLGSDTIQFDASLAGQTISLTNGQHEITESLNIDGSALSGGITVDAQQNSRAMLFSAGAGDLQLINLTVTGGRTTGDHSGNEVTFSGGGVRFDSLGTLTIVDSSIIGNQVNGSFVDGGGIFAREGNISLIRSQVYGNQVNGNGHGGGFYSIFGDVTLLDTTVHDNQAVGQGGGIASVAGLITINDSTVSGNQSGSFGGGVSSFFGDIVLQNSTVSGNFSATNGGGIYSVRGQQLNILNSTVTGNSSPSQGGVTLYDTYNPAGSATLNIRNSIIAGNSGAAPDVSTGTTDVVVNVDYSLIGNTNGSNIDSNTGQSNLLNVDARLGALADNGGPTLTHALFLDSPALNAGDPEIVFDSAQFDQRGVGFARVVGSAIDIGALESQVLPSADFDSDGDVDGSDFLAWQRGFSTANATPADGDADSDNDVDGFDLSIWQNQFGQQAPASPPVAAVASGSSIVDTQSAVGSRQRVVESVPDSALSAELVDAAIMLSAAEEAPLRPSISPIDQEALVEQPMADAVTSQHAASPTRSTDNGKAIGESSEVESVEYESSWLSEELLERVFG